MKAKLVLLLVVSFVAVKANEEADLFAAIIGGYPELGKYVRPVAKVADTVTVDVGFYPIRFAGFAKKGGHSGYGTLTVEGWPMMSWTDVNIGWDPSEYAGIASMTIPQKLVNEKIWIPDIVPFDGLPWTDRIEDVDVVVMSSGMVIRVPPGTFHFDCAPNAAGNATVCVTSFGSWSQNGNLVDVGATPTVDVSSLVKDPEWTLVSAEAERIVKKYDCCPEPYTTAKVTLTLKSNSKRFDYDRAWNTVPRK